MSNPSDKGQSKVVASDDEVKFQDRIPFEVWAEVLLWMKPRWSVSSSGRIQLPKSAKLATVCKTWENVVKECGRFWANVQVQVGDAFEGDEDNYLAFLDRFKHRVTAERLLDVVLEHARRFKSLTLDVGGWDESVCEGYQRVALRLPAMTSLSFLAMDNVPFVTGPWSLVLTRLLEHVTGKTLGWTRLKELRLDSGCWHRDAMYQCLSPNPCTSNTLTHIDAHVAVLVAVSMIEGFSALVEACFSFTEPRREVWGAYVHESPVVHNHLLRLTVKTTPYLQRLVRRTFPHSPFSSILNQLTLPRLLHLGVCVNPGHAVLPVGLEAPSKDTEYACRLMESEDWDESEPDSEDEMNWYLGVQEDRARYKKGFVFKKVKDKSRLFGATLEDPFFPDHLDGFLSRSPLLESLDLVAIPFEGPQLIRVLEKTPNLVQISLREVAVMREEEKLYPEPLANNVLLNWLGDAIHLPRLEFILLHLTRFPPTGSCLESMLEARYALMSGSTHVLKHVEVDCKEIDARGKGKFDYKRLEALENGGLSIMVPSYELRQMGGRYGQRVRGERAEKAARTNFHLRPRIPNGMA
ncbi:hypothetical protein AAF712_008569 [Marasmius tenuissimus]|uniref:F-box domain-containing protein n=1 Tax=Marasmius tenuissimus TaxID=585030 RepID=A0ABR2ZSF5_9AGAR